ncbi:MAG: PilZ domain-containing protein [Planctomycetota bacterium]
MIEPTLPSDTRAPGRERRRFPRAPLDLPLTVTLEDGAHEGRLRDVSRAGISFFLDRQIPEMTVLSMRFDLPRTGGQPAADPPVTGSGVVVRCRALSPHVDHYEIAVFLHEIAERDRERIDRFVAGPRR